MILDEQLADMDAVDFMEEYRTQKLQHRPAILVLSCRSHMAICDCLLSCGADYCIMKPYQLSTLARRARMPRGDLGDLAFPLPDEARDVTLFRSILEPRGARYKPLYTVGLRAGE